jgi:ATP-dependent helicase/nuclease subunit B
LAFDGTPPFTLSGKADRIDILKNGNAAILDYKSGRAPSKKQVNQFLAPQLPLEAAMLKRGAFQGLGKHASETLLYLSLADEKNVRKPVHFDNAMELAEEAHARLKAHIARFHDPATPYPSRVMPYRTDSTGDYDHLARVREWAVSGGQDFGDGGGE